MATSSNHAELIALYEASRECVLLRFMIGKLQEDFLNDTTRASTTIYEDNDACINQVREEYIRGDRTKHLSPKLFFAHDLQKDKKIKVQEIQSCENPVDLLTKSRPSKQFEYLVRKIGMCHFRDIC